jgi:hypothetical protein
MAPSSELARVLNRRRSVVDDEGTHFEKKPLETRVVDARCSPRQCEGDAVDSVPTGPPNVPAKFSERPVEAAAKQRHVTGTTRKQLAKLEEATTTPRKQPVKLEGAAPLNDPNEQSALDHSFWGSPGPVHGSPSPRALGFLEGDVLLQAGLVPPLALPVREPRIVNLIDWSPAEDTAVAFVRSGIKLMEGNLSARCCRSVIDAWRQECCARRTEQIDDAVCCATALRLGATDIRSLLAHVNQVKVEMDALDEISKARVDTFTNPSPPAADSDVEGLAAAFAKPLLPVRRSLSTPVVDTDAKGLTAALAQSLPTVHRWHAFGATESSLSHARKHSNGSDVSTSSGGSPSVDGTTDTEVMPQTDPVQVPVEVVSTRWSPTTIGLLSSGACPPTGVQGLRCGQTPFLIGATTTTATLTKTVTQHITTLTQQLLCSKGHVLRIDVRPTHICNLCRRQGTVYRCSQGCDWDACQMCWGEGLTAGRCCQAPKVQLAVTV